MRHVTRIETSDGILHIDRDRAKRHAEKRYGEALSNLAHQLLRRDKYTAMQEFVDENLPAFAELSALKADITLQICPNCKGKGEVETEIGMLSCDACGGTGNLIKE